MNPMGMIQMLLKRNLSPMESNLINMAQKNDVDGLMNFGRNIYKEKGNGDFDKDLANFAKQFGSK